MAKPSGIDLSKLSFEELQTLAQDAMVAMTACTQPMTDCTQPMTDCT